MATKRQDQWEAHDFTNPERDQWEAIGVSDASLARALIERYGDAGGVVRVHDKETLERISSGEKAVDYWEPGKKRAGGHGHRSESDSGEA